ncbi:hypothetical protein BKA80DRAFT_35500 [Phyllosticta citrichinensis]
MRRYSSGVGSRAGRLTRFWPPRLSPLLLRRPHQSVASQRNGEPHRSATGVSHRGVPSQEMAPRLRGLSRRGSSQTLRLAQRLMESSRSRSLVELGGVGSRTAGRQSFHLSRPWPERRPSLTGRRMSDCMQSDPVPCPHHHTLGVVLNYGCRPLHDCHVRRNVCPTFSPCIATCIRLVPFLCPRRSESRIRLQSNTAALGKTKAVAEQPPMACQTQWFQVVVAFFFAFTGGVISQFQRLEYFQS